MQLSPNSRNLRSRQGPLSVRYSSLGQISIENSQGSSHKIFAGRVVIDLILAVEFPMTNHLIKIGLSWNPSLWNAGASGKS